MTRASRLASLVVTTVLTLCAGAANGQPAPAAPPPEQRAMELFDEGRNMMTQTGKLEEACSKLADSYELAKRGDTLLNLAECHRRQGKTATAWREFDHAIRYAQDVEYDEAIEFSHKN